MLAKETQQTIDPEEMAALMKPMFIQHELVVTPSTTYNLFVAPVNNEIITIPIITRTYVNSSICKIKNIQVFDVSEKN